MSKFNNIVISYLNNSKVWEFLKDTFPKEKKVELQEDFIDTLNSALNENVALIEGFKNSEIKKSYCSKCGIKKDEIFGAHCHSPTCPHEYE